MTVENEELAEERIRRMGCSSEDDFMINPRRWIHEKAKNQTLAKHKRQVIFLTPFCEQHC